MTTEQDLTIATYNSKFGEYKKVTAQEVNGIFKVWIDEVLDFSKGDNLLEIGSAHGRDAKYFKSLGYKVLCTDIIDQALLDLSEKGFDVEKFDFRNKPNEDWKNRFNIIFANGVFLHATKKQMESAFKNLYESLSDDGVIVFSVKAGIGEEIHSDKVGAPRYFNYWTEEELRNMLNAIGLYEILDFRSLEDGKWLNVTVRKK